VLATYGIGGELEYTRRVLPYFGCGLDQLEAMLQTASGFEKGRENSHLYFGAWKNQLIRLLIKNNADHMPGTHTHIIHI